MALADRTDLDLSTSTSSTMPDGSPAIFPFKASISSFTFPVEVGRGTSVSFRTLIFNAIEFLASSPYRDSMVLLQAKV